MKAEVRQFFPSWENSRVRPPAEISRAESEDGRKRRQAKRRRNIIRRTPPDTVVRWGVYRQ
jgi:hypothetical protein